MLSKQSSETARSSSRNWLRRIWAILPALFFILLLGVIVVLGGWIKSQGESLQEKKAAELRQDQPPVNVVTLSLTPGPVSERINLPGVVRPWISLRVSAEVRAKIVAKDVSQGQTVSKGQILARLDERDFQNAYASAGAAFRAAKANHDRIQALAKDRLATQAQLDDGVAQLETTQAALDNVALNLERCVIRSPMDGVVDHLPIEVGQFLSVGDPVADLLQIDRLKVEVGIPESDVAAVRRIRSFRMSVDALEGRVYEGKFHFLSKSTENRAMLYRLEIALENPDGALLPDMFTRVEIVKKTVSDGLAVPLFALLDDKEQRTVFVANGHKAHRRIVTTGIQDGWRVQITQGLQPDDQIVVVGQRGLNDGDPIQIVRSVDRIEELDQ